MKKWIIIALAVLVFQKWHVVDSYINPLPDYGSAHDVEVLMYGTEGCEDCEAAKQFMDKNNITFYEYDIEISSEGKKQYAVLGGNGVPLLLINGMKIKGFKPKETLSLAKGSDGFLGRLGY
jgi:glutaredoxin